MAELTNKVEIQGDISGIRKTDNGSIFAQINQEFTGHDSKPHVRFFRFYIRNDKVKDLEPLCTESAKVTIKGTLDIFKSKFGPTVMVDVNEIVPDASQPAPSAK